MGWYLIRAGKACAALDDQTQEEMRLTRGTLTEAGAEGPPYRNRSVEENLDLLRRMRSGEVSERCAGAARQDRYGLR